MIEHLTTLLRTQLFLTVLILLPAAVLGTLTGSLSQAMLFDVLRPRGRRVRLFSNRRSLSAGQGWIGTPIAASLLACTGVATFWCSNTGIAGRSLACIAFFVVALSPGSIVHGPTTPRPSSQSRHSTLDRAHPLPTRSAVDRCIHIDNIPAGVEPITASVRLHHITKYDARLQTFEAFHSRFRGGAGWLTIYESQKFFEPWTSGVVVEGYSGDLDVVLFDQPRTFPVPLNEPVVIPGIGPCSRKKADHGLLDVVCVSPWPRASLAIQSPGAAKQWIVEQLAFESTLPSARTLTPLHKFSTSLFLRPEELLAARLISGQLLGQRHLTFDLPNLPLIPQQ